MNDYGYEFLSRTDPYENELRLRRHVERVPLWDVQTGDVIADPMLGFMGVGVVRIVTLLDGWKLVEVDTATDDGDATVLLYVWTQRTSLDAQLAWPQPDEQCKRPNGLTHVGIVRGMSVRWHPYTRTSDGGWQVVFAGFNPFRWPAHLAEALDRVLARTDVRSITSPVCAQCAAGVMHTHTTGAN